MLKLGSLWGAGLALGVALMGLPWKVHGIMLAGSEEYYKRQQQDLTAAFTAAFAAGVRSVTIQAYEYIAWRKHALSYLASLNLPFSQGVWHKT